MIKFMYSSKSNTKVVTFLQHMNDLYVSSKKVLMILRNNYTLSGIKRLVTHNRNQTKVDYQLPFMQLNHN